METLDRPGKPSRRRSRAVLWILLLLVVGLSSAGLLSLFLFTGNSRDSAKLRDTGCEEMPLASVQKCRSWDDSFQDANFYQVAWGAPQTRTCQSVLNRARSKAPPKAGRKCDWAGGGWQPEACGTFAIDSKFRCFVCTWANAGDHYGRLQAYTSDCSKGIVFNTGGVALTSVMKAATSESGFPAVE